MLGVYSEDSRFSETDLVGSTLIGIKGVYYLLAASTSWPINEVMSKLDTTCKESRRGESKCGARITDGALSQRDGEIIDVGAYRPGSVG